MKKSFKQKMAEYWDENQIILKPFIFCVVFSGLVGAGFVGLNSYREKQADERYKNEKLEALKAAQQVQDTVVANVNKKQK